MIMAEEDICYGTAIINARLLLFKLLATKLKRERQRIERERDIMRLFGS